MIMFSDLGKICNSWMSLTSGPLHLSYILWSFHWVCFIMFPMTYLLTNISFGGSTGFWMNSIIIKIVDKSYGVRLGSFESWQFCRTTYWHIAHILPLSHILNQFQYEERFDNHSVTLLFYLYRCKFKVIQYQHWRLHRSLTCSFTCSFIPWQHKQQ